MASSDAWSCIQQGWRSSQNTRQIVKISKCPLPKALGTKIVRMSNACKTSSCAFPLALQKTIMASQKNSHFSQCYAFWGRDDTNKPVHLQDRLSACRLWTQWLFFTAQSSSHAEDSSSQAGAGSALWSEALAAGGCEQVAAPAATIPGCPWPPGSCSALLHPVLEPQQRSPASDLCLKCLLPSALAATWLCHPVTKTFWVVVDPKYTSLKTKGCHVKYLPQKDF